MQTRGYEDPIILKVMELLNANGPSKLKGKYIHGDVMLPNESDLPICYITKDQVLAEPANTMEDEHRQLLVATVVLNFTRDLNTAYNIVAGSGELFEFCEGRTDDFKLRQDTLLYQLRNSQEIAPKLFIGVGSPVQINYGLGIERRGPGILSVEAVMRFTVRLHTPRPPL